MLAEITNIEHEEKSDNQRSARSPCSHLFFDPRFLTSWRGHRDGVAAAICRSFAAFLRHTESSSEESGKEKEKWSRKHGGIRTDTECADRLPFYEALYSSLLGRRAERPAWRGAPTLAVSGLSSYAQTRERIGRDDFNNVVLPFTTVLYAVRNRWRSVNVLLSSSVHNNNNIIVEYIYRVFDYVIEHTECVLSMCYEYIDDDYDYVSNYTVDKLLGLCKPYSV